MSAGTGVIHSEHNASTTAPVHFLQIWIRPDRAGHAPRYDQREFPVAERAGRLRLVASPDGAEGSLAIHADARVYATVLAAGQAVTLPLAADRHAWVQVARGRVRVNDRALAAGDGAALSAEPALALAADADADAELLVFDLA